jgi:hypothetical protein
MVVILLRLEAQQGQLETILSVASFRMADSRIASCLGQHRDNVVNEADGCNSGRGIGRLAVAEDQDNG